MKNSDRADALRRILSDSFAPRFAEINRKLTAALRAHIAQEHPVFRKMMDDDTMRGYVAFSNMTRFRINENIAAIPSYGVCGEMPTGTHLGYGNYCSAMTDSDTPVPAGLGRVSVNDSDLWAEYTSAWSDYLAARNKVMSLLRSYKTRDKLAADFPEFAKYIPPAVVKAKLPSVIVADVRADLKGFGVPCSK